MPFPALIGLGLGAGASIFGQTQAAKEQSRFNAWLDKTTRDNDNWYKKESNTDYLDTSEGRSQYEGLKRILKKNYKTIDNSAVKGGATAESQLANKEQSAEVLANATANLAAQGTRRKDNIRREYMYRKSNLDNLRAGNMQARSQSWGNFASNAGNMMSSFITADASGAFKDIFKKPPVQ